MMFPSRWVYWSALGILIPSTLYTVGWFVMDIMARVGIWPDGLIPFDVYGFVASTPAVEEAAFFINTVTKVIALILLLRNSRWSFPVFLFSYVFHIADWVSLVGNAYYDSSVDGTIQIAVQMVVVALLAYLYIGGAFADSRSSGVSRARPARTES